MMQMNVNATRMKIKTFRSSKNQFVSLPPLPILNLKTQKNHPLILLIIQRQFRRINNKIENREKRFGQ